MTFSDAVEIQNRNLRIHWRSSVTFQGFVITWQDPLSKFSLQSNWYSPRSCPSPQVTCFITKVTVLVIPSQFWTQMFVLFTCCMYKWQLQLAKYTCMSTQCRIHLKFTAKEHQFISLYKVCTQSMQNLSCQFVRFLYRLWPWHSDFTDRTMTQTCSIFHRTILLLYLHGFRIAVTQDQLMLSMKFWHIFSIIFYILTIIYSVENMCSWCNKFKFPFFTMPYWFDVILAPHDQIQPTMARDDPVLASSNFAKASADYIEVLKRKYCV